jgi:hypothetical protein
MHRSKAPVILDPLSYSDYLQCAAAVAIEGSDGPENLILDSFAYGRKEINSNEDYLKEECYETYNDHYKERMTALKFTPEEITALAHIESFGSIDVSENFYVNPRFTNTYYKNLISLGQAEKNVNLKSDSFLLSKSNPYLEHVKRFAADKKEFKRVFHDAFIKMTRIGFEPKQLSTREELFETVELRIP